MFCPNCKYEYREGFSTCSDCGSTLVKELSQRKTNDKEIKEMTLQNVEYEYAEFVYLGRPQEELMFVESILIGEGVTYYIKGKYDFKAPKQIFVKKDEKETALEVLKAFNITVD